jgi:hypothetical protein
VRAALAPLGVATINGTAQVEEQQQRHAAHSSRRTLPDVTAHARVNRDVYLPNAQVGTIVAARDDAPGTAICYVKSPNGLIDMYRSTDLEYVTDTAPVLCPCRQRMTNRLQLARYDVDVMPVQAAHDIPRLRPTHDQQESGIITRRLAARQLSRGTYARIGPERGKGVAVSLW